MAAKVYPLNSARFFMALLVIYHHSAKYFIPALNPHNVQSTHQNYFTAFSLEFRISVSFFFLLSGYSLASAYLKKGRGLDNARFLVARVARLYPLYLFVFAIEAAILLRGRIHMTGLIHGVTSSVEVFTANGLLLQAIYPQRWLLINIPTWSLSGEIFFCICFPFLATWLWKLSGAWLWWAALALYVGGQALVWAIQPGTDLEFWSFWPPLHLTTFLLGVLMARWQTLQQQRKEPLAVKAWQANAVLVAAIVATLLCVPLEGIFHLTRPWAHGLLAPMYMAGIWSLSTTSTAVTRWFSGKWMVALGNGSYAMYLVHNPILDVFVRHRWISLWMYPLFFALCVGFSLLSFPYVETPIRLWLIARFDARRLRRTVGAPEVALPVTQEP
jgi:peptidoglycan/LPS O-acetylase OafA/YrhL